MKLLRCLFALTLVSAISGMARANDFKIGIQDSPPSPIDYTGSPLTVSFGSCNNGVPTDGCVTIANDTVKTLTSLVLDIVPNSYTIADGGGGCLTTSPSIHCSYSEINDDLYQFLFTGLDIPPSSEVRANDTFTIEEQGICPSDFPEVTVSPAVTPEPASLLLLATGFLLCAGFIYRRRTDAANLGS